MQYCVLDDRGNTWFFDKSCWHNGSEFIQVVVDEISYHCKNVILPNFNVFYKPYLKIMLFLYVIG